LEKQKQYFINGIFLVALGLLSVTIAPLIIKQAKGFASVENYVFYEFEFIFFLAAALYFVFSPKYYKGQIVCAFIGILYYILFTAIYKIGFTLSKIMPSYWLQAPVQGLKTIFQSNLQK